MPSSRGCWNKSTGSRRATSAGSTWLWWPCHPHRANSLWREGVCLSFSTGFTRVLPYRWDITPKDLSTCEVFLVLIVYNGRAWTYRTGDPDDFFDLQEIGYVGLPCWSKCMWSYLYDQGLRYVVYRLKPSVKIISQGACEKGHPGAEKER